MKLNILTPEKNVFEGIAKSVNLPGLGGRFQILDQHAPMIAALTKGSVNITNEKGEKQSIEILSGFCEVLKNEVNLLVRM